MRRLGCCLILGILLAGCGGGDDEVVRLGLIRPSLNHLPYDLAALADDPSLAAVEVTYFASGWEANEALAAGRLDAAILPFTYAWADVDRGLPVKVVGFLERESDGIVARREFASLDDLAGRRIGVLRASTLEVLAVMALSDRRIEAELVPFRTPAEMTAALQSGEVDALSFYVPPILALGDEVHVLHWYSDDHPMHPCCDLAVHTGNAPRKREALSRLRAALAIAAVRIESDREAAATLAGRTFGLTPTVAARSLARQRFLLGRELEGRKFELRAARVMRELGYLESIPDTGDVYLDLERR